MHHALRRLLPSLLAVTALLVVTTEVATQGPGGGGRSPDRETLDGRDVVAGEVLVKFRTPQGRADRDQLNYQLGIDRDEDIGGVGVRRLRSRVFDTLSMLAFFRGQPNVEYVEPNYILVATAPPNDPKFFQLWACTTRPPRTLTSTQWRRGIFPRGRAPMLWR